MAGELESVVQLRIELRHTRPKIWRRVIVPADLTLRRLHDVIQAVFGWEDYHLHEFLAGGTRYGQTEHDDADFGPSLRSDRNTRLATLLERGVKKFSYIYDFGDDWEHIVTVQRIGAPAEGMEYPVLAAAAGRAPPEDCGGVPGYEMLLEAMADPRHEEHANVTEWLGGAFDPNDVDVQAIETRLRPIRAARRRGPAKGSRSTSRKVWTRRK